MASEALSPIIIFIKSFPTSGNTLRVFFLSVKLAIANSRPANRPTNTKFDEKIGEVLPLLQSIVDEAKAEQDNSSKALADRIMTKIKAGDSVDMHEPNATQQEYDPEKVGSFTNKDAKVAYRLSDLAAKIKDDEMSVFLARLSYKFTSYATDPNIQMKIKQDPETYQIQPWEKETAKAIIQCVKMKTVNP